MLLQECKVGAEQEALDAVLILFYHHIEHSGKYNQSWDMVQRQECGLLFSRVPYCLDTQLPGTGLDPFPPVPAGCNWLHFLG